MNINQTSLNKPLSQFVVFEYGQPATRYNDELIKIERSEAFKNAGKELVQLSLENSLKALKWAGTVSLNVVDEFVQSANQPSA